VSPEITGGTAPGAKVTFAQVSAAGTTSVAVSSAGPPVSGVFIVPASTTYYDVSTTATHTGSIILCLPYDPTTYPDPRLVRLLHWNGTSWDDVTKSVDSANSTVCGTSTSLSPFVVAQRAAAPNTSGSATAAGATPTAAAPRPIPANGAARPIPASTSGGFLIGLIVMVLVVVVIAAWLLIRRHKSSQARL